LCDDTPVKAETTLSEPLVGPRSGPAAHVDNAGTTVIPGALPAAEALRLSAW
jgi:hypothetical protein